MPVEDFFMYAVFGLIAGIVLFLKGFREWSVKRLIENTPTSSIRSIAMGFVEIAGSVTKPLNNFFKAPFTGKDCVYYEFRIDEEKRDSKGRAYWVTVKSGQDLAPFYVKDKTGIVLVDPRSARMDLVPDFDQQPIRIPESIRKFCEKNKIATSTLFWNKKLRFVETHLAPNDLIYVLGTAADNPFVKEATSIHGVEDIMIQKANKPFYISDQSEKNVLTLFAWKAYGGVYGGGLLFIVSLGIFLWSIGIW